MRPQFVFLVIAFSVPLTLCAQQDSPPIVSVKASPKGEMSASHSAVIMRAMCDDAGNVFSRPFHPEKGWEAVRAPLQTFTSGAKATESFSVTDALTGGTESRTFSVQGDRIFVPMMSKKGELYVVEFAQDGSVKARTKLEPGVFVDVFHLAVFKSGEYLIVGLTGTLTGTTPHLSTPFTAVFAANGRLVKRIYEPEDEEARQRAEASDPKYLLCCSSSGNEFVQYNADIVSGSDGKVYLLHGTSPPLIYVISPAGDVLRKLQISVSHPDLTANSIKFFNGRLAIGFSWLGKVPRSLIKVIDTEGIAVGDYEVIESTGDSDPILACYNSEGVTLLPRWVGTKPYLLTAKLP